MITSKHQQYILQESERFIKDCYLEMGYSPECIGKRIMQIREEVMSCGTYAHTKEELVHGAKMAWRNNGHCVGRLFWPSLEVIDERHSNTKEEVLGALLHHIQLATNKGRIRSVMTIFAPEDAQGQQPVRIWNHQLIRYAGYANIKDDKGIIGDPASVIFTNECLKLGWTGAGTPFDILPLVVQMSADVPTWKCIPSSHIVEIPLVHPEQISFSELGLRWYAVPIISDMVLEIGGIRYPAAPFNGWYMETEIGARNLADYDRYNKLPEVAKVFGLDTSTNTSLWKDRALVELNRAVLHSYKLNGISIVDHHTASEQFIRFEQQEIDAGRSVSGRWSWLIPPMSPATTKIWRNSYKNLKEKPALEAQTPPYHKGKSEDKVDEETLSHLTSEPQCPFH